MFLIDDILLAPFRAILWLVREVKNAADKDQEAEVDRIKDRLREMYMQLETGQMSEQQFDAQEKILLDRLDELEGQAPPQDPASAAPVEDAEGDEDDEEEDEDADEEEEDEDEEEEDEDEEEEDEDEEEEDEDDPGDGGEQGPRS